MYCWGSNSSGQCGYQTQSQTEQVPKKVEAIPKISNAVCGRYHTLLLKSKGEVYVCGNNKDASLGIHNKKDKVYLPMRLDFPVPITQIAASDFSVAVTEDSDMYVWGDSPLGYDSH